MPLAKQYPAIELADAYAIQALALHAKRQQGARLCGHKVGLALPARRARDGAREPIRGHLLDHMLVPNGATIDSARLISPRVEVELAFVLGQRHEGSYATLAKVLSATDHVVAAIDVVDGRMRAPRALIDTVADNDAAAAVVLGGYRAKPEDVDLRWAGAILYRNRVAQESGIAGANLEHPAQSLVWLADDLSRHGEALEAGDVLLAGAFARPVAARKGDTIYADFGSLGAISLHFG